MLLHPHTDTMAEEEKTLLKTEGNITEGHGHLYDKKSDNFDKMNKFLKRHKLAKSGQEEMENLNTTVRKTGIELGIRNPPAKKSLGPDGLNDEFCKILTEDISPFHHIV